VEKLEETIEVEGRSGPGVDSESPQ
jgi:hypothetical protein